MGTTLTLQDIANYGEILDAAGVIASLILVGWQIRANTRATRLHMHDQVTQTYMSFLNAVLRDPAAFSMGLQSESADFETLSDGEKLFFFGTPLGLFKHFENMYVQFSHGVMDTPTWTPGACIFVCIFTSPASRPGGASEKGHSFRIFSDFSKSLNRPKCQVSLKWPANDAVE